MKGYYKEVYTMPHNNYRESDRNNYSKNAPQHPTSAKIEVLPNSGFRDYTEKGVRYEKFHLDAAFKIEHVKCQEFRFIQIVMIKPNKKNRVGTRIQLEIFRGQKEWWDVFVDGGINSPGVKKGSLNPNSGKIEIQQIGEVGKPYFLNKKMREGLIAQGFQFQCKANSGSPCIQDAQTAAIKHEKIRFHTYLVAVNFNLSSKDRILGKIVWTFYKDGQDIFATHTKQINFRETNEIDEYDKKIILNDYPNYQI